MWNWNKFIESLMKFLMNLSHLLIVSSLVLWRWGLMFFWSKFKTKGLRTQDQPKNQIWNPPKGTMKIHYSYLIYWNNYFNVPNVFSHRFISRVALSCFEPSFLMDILTHLMSKYIKALTNQSYLCCPLITNHTHSK